MKGVIFKTIKRHITNWEKIFAVIISDQVLVSTTYKELSKFDMKTEPNLKKKANMGTVNKDT